MHAKRPNSRSLQAVDRGCLAVLVEACSARSPDNDVRALAIQCLAALSMHFDLREPLLAAGAVQALCRVAKLREAMLQVPTAAALANMCSNPAFLSQAADVDDTMAALNTLSLSGNRDVQVRPAPRLPPQFLLQGSVAVPGKGFLGTDHNRPMGTHGRPLCDVQHSKGAVLIVEASPEQKQP